MVGKESDCTQSKQMVLDCHHLGSPITTWHVTTGDISPGLRNNYTDDSSRVSYGTFMICMITFP